MKTPTDKEKIEMYEKYLHAINMAVVCGNQERVVNLISNADRWSYAHRVGNGELSKEEQDKVVHFYFLKLLD